MKAPDFKKALNEMLSKPTSGKTQAAMDRLLDNVLWLRNRLRRFDSSYQD